MKNKKLLLLVMALLMMVSMSTPAIAVELNGHRSTKIEVGNRLPEIRVTVPPSVNVLINPYKIPVVIEDVIVGEQIISDSAAIKNESEVPLKVSVSMTTSIKEGSDLRLLSDSTKGEELTSKRAFIYFEIQAVSNPDRVSWDKEYDEDKHLLVRVGTRNMKNMVTLGADEMPFCYGAFRLAGDCVEFPRSAWTELDGIDVRITFSFEPTKDAPQG